MNTLQAIEPCRAGYEGCDSMRLDAARKHPRTASVRECRHMAIPPERPDKLQGPEIDALCLYKGETVRVVERSYVWAPGDPSYHGGSRRYDWKVIDRGNGRTLCVDDKDLTAID